ncbi:MAG: MmgE/PrpD family protein [Alphaproteobacteria bacterium]|nr:MmgE/PrpD family protein [Alphaproteobacteria bacterium]
MLGDFVHDVAFDALPAATVAKTKRHVMDTLGAALAGATSEEARRARAALAACDGPGATPLWGTTERLSPRNAALVNGIAAHAFELDDTGGCDHSGAVVLPAAIAALDLAAAPVSGREFLLAVVLGYDVGRRVLEAFGGYKPHNEAGWHSTGTCGVFGAAAAVARILRLDRGQCRAALGIAASGASGIWAFIHDGTMTKRLHAGRAAEGGLLAGVLAQRGITGPARIFDDVWGGFLKSYAHKPVDPDALTRDLGRKWRVDIAAIKPYASCRDTHCAVDAVGRLLAREAIAADAVERIEVRANDFLIGMVGGRDVATLPAAQMSLPYAVSARIVFGSAGLSSYAPEKRGDARVRRLLERVTLVRDPAILGSDRSVVSIFMGDGRRLDEPTRIPLGAPDNPVDDAGLEAKFRELATMVLPTSRAGDLARAALDLDRMANAGDLRALLAAER